MCRKAHIIRTANIIRLSRHHLRDRQTSFKKRTFVLVDKSSFLLAEMKRLSRKAKAFLRTRRVTKLREPSIHSDTRSLRNSSLSLVQNSYQLFSSAPSCASVALVQISLRREKQKRSPLGLRFAGGDESNVFKPVESFLDKR